MTQNMIKFDLPKAKSSIIKVFGIGGGGCNAVNHMFQQGIKDVDFVVCNTDSQSLENSPVANKIQLGVNLLQGLGAGAIPTVGKEAAEENIDRVKELLEKNTRMVFITAGMGGGTGTGAAPIIAKAAKELGILTVGIVTLPFCFEGKKRSSQAEEGIKKLREHVDTMLVIRNDKIRDMYGNLDLRIAYSHADDVLTTAAKGIAEIITVHGYMNVDFNDVKTVMTNGGTAIMGYATAEGENRAIQAIEQALNCPLLNDNDIKGAQKVLTYVTSGVKEVTMDEFAEIHDYIQDAAGSTANIIIGAAFDESLGEKLNVIIVATDFQPNAIPDLGLIGETAAKNTPTIHKLENKKEIVEIVAAPVIEEKENLEPYLKTSTTSDEHITEDITLTTFTETPTDEIEQEEEFKLVFKQPELEIVNTIEQINTVEKQPFVQKISSDNIQQNNLENVSRNTVKQPEAKQAEQKVMEAKEVFTLNDSQLPLKSTEEMTKQWADRKEKVNRLKDISIRLKNRNVSDLEREPAYVRRNVSLSSVTPSNESLVSRYTLGDGSENKTELKENNGFLHDNVD